MRSNWLPYFVSILCLSTMLRAADAPKRDDSASEKLGIKLSLQCYTYRAITFFETVDKAAAMGIKYLEIYPGQKLSPASTAKVEWSSMSDAAIDEIKKKLAEAGGLKLVAYGVAAIPPKEEDARKMYEWAKKMGIEVLVTETKPTEMHDKLCTEFNIKMALHNHPKSWPPDEVLAACKDRCPLIGSCSDTGHFMRRGLVPVEQFKKLGARVLHCHFKDLNDYSYIKDATHDKDGPGVHDLPWGTGKGDAKGMLTQLKAQGFKGYTSIEYEFGSVKELDENLPKCIKFYDETLTELAK
ncbi:MAG TPA: sugar phosphate isomerase/epimerase [Planctomycetota bacterium]|nr:sugar phosphate isomerase/epimerase [Planctomycetota bacterium]